MGGGRFLGFAGGLAGAAVLLATGYFFRLAVVRLPPTAPPLDLPAPRTPDDLAWATAQSFTELTITSHDGLGLRGYFLPAPAPSDHTVVIIHGYRCQALPDMAGWARVYHEQFGANVFLADARAHGASDGTYIGFGWLDRRDVRQWLQLLLARLGPEAVITLHGISMGGATVAMVSGDPLPAQVRCLVVDCAYTSVKDECRHQLRAMYHLPPVPFIPLTSLVCRLRAGYFFEAASAVRQVARATRPMLFIHGGSDDFVPTRMSEALAAACPAPTELLIIPHAEHGMASLEDPARYWATVRAFLRQHGVPLAGG